MWWLDPGKEVLNIVFKRILSNYVENLDLNNVNYGVQTGQITLRNLTLKRGALDNFRLPVDVLEGHLGKFTLSLHWLNLGNQPVEILIEDVFLLVVPSTESAFDPEDEEKRAQALKRERLQNAELLHMQGQAETNTDNSAQTQGLWESLTAKIINNIQVTIKNIHVRYEDKLSVPGHPFAVGITLASLSAVSVDDQWKPAFIDSSAGAIHKLAELQSLAVYFDTDSPSQAGLPKNEFLQRFMEMIASNSRHADHQFILKPVSGQGRIIMNRLAVDKDKPRFDVQLLFDEIGVLLDNDQYRDTISLLDMYHVYIRQHQYRKYMPESKAIKENPAKARLQFATSAILNTIKEKNRKWTWAYFAERRDDRNRYVELFQKQQLSTLTLVAEIEDLERLEEKLSYEDIRFYRSIGRSRLRKDEALRKRLEQDKAKQQPQAQSWSSWIWGSSQEDKSRENDPAFGGPMSEEQRQQLYDVLDFDEKSGLAESLQGSRDAMVARVHAKLDKGSFALLNNPRGQANEVVSVVFDVFSADIIKRADNLEASVALMDFSVVDGTTTDTLYPKIMYVKESVETNKEDPFLFVKFENNPLDERADNALTVRMRHMEVIYHRGYVEAVYKFFKPPESQLESVEALLTAAGQTLEGFSKETRAGLEYALQSHKTIDIQMDMNAPVIIVPEDVTTSKCKHLIVDAGYISIESDLADKEAINSVALKKNQKYDDEDYKRLQTLMYDRFTLKLQDAQFVLGNDLELCRRAMTSRETNTLHLVERINIDLVVQNSIVPSVVSLARFKISGNLPTLQLNMSDFKYKSLMRLIDVALPRFGSEASTPIEESRPSRFPVTSGFFQPTETEYTVDDEGSVETHTEIKAQDEPADDPMLHQHTFELDFRVEQMKVVISKVNADDVERPIGDVSLDMFSLVFALAKFDMRADVKLRALSMNLIRANGGKPIQFMSSPDLDVTHNKDLLSVVYTRAQRESPEFNTVFEGIDQRVQVRISTFIFRAAPEPVISLYDFIMTTFVPKNDNPPLESNNSAAVVQTQGNNDSGKIAVGVDLESVQVVLVNGEASLATLSLSTANVSVLLWKSQLKVSGKLGSLSLTNDSAAFKKKDGHDFGRILSIEGDKLAEFNYQTYDPEEPGWNGIKSTVSLNVASLKLHFLEQPLHDIYFFVVKFARLKGLYDAATTAAIESAPQLDRMLFDISIQSPIVVVPFDALASQDTLVLRLGEITARNKYEADVSNIAAGLTGIQLISQMHYEEGISTLKIIDDIDVTADVTQAIGIDRTQNFDVPDTQVSVRISDVKLHLTQPQYVVLMGLAQSIPRVLAGAPEGYAQAESSASPGRNTPNDSKESRSVTPADLAPELVKSSDALIWPSVDLVVAIGAVKLHLYDEHATTTSNLKEHGIMRFALNQNELRFKQLSDSSGEAQVVFKSFTMANTRSGQSRFREIIPAAQHDRNQFMVLYTMAGGSSPSSLAVVTIDSPQVIFAMDPIFALVTFFTSHQSDQEPEHAAIEDVAQEEEQQDAPQSSFDFRLDLHDVSINLLENDTNPETQSLKLSIKQVMVSQQGVLAVNVDRLGMSLVTMGKESDSVRFLDDVDLTLSLDSRSSLSQQMTNIEVTAKPIVFRASYRDIILITSIVNKAIELSSQGSKPQDVHSASGRPGKPSHISSRRSSTRRTGTSKPVGKARVIASKEQLKGSFDGFRLVLIGDMHEQPMLHLKVKRFIVGAKDWTGELHATSTLATQISYWNLTNSHWEPLIDPWTFTMTASKKDASSGISLGLSARDCLDLNLSTTFAEMAVTSFNMWTKEGERVLQNARGSYAPYKIRNRTGSPIYVWSDDDGSGNNKENASVKVLSDDSVDWRFDDWKTLREHVTSSGQHSIGVQIVGQPWEQIRSVPVDREGEYTFPLRPRTEKYTNRLLCEVNVVDNVKVVTIRSTYKVQNMTLYPLEVTLVDDNGHPVHSLEKIVPGQEFALPIDGAVRHRIRIQPDQGFGYKWCPAIRWEDLVSTRRFTIRCPHNDPNEASFRFQAWVDTDHQGGTARFPKITVKLRAPIELENLLPYNLQYRVYDKDTDQNWRSYLRKGGVMPVHSVELGHLVLLNVELEDTVFAQSEFAIINTDVNSDFDTEKRLTLKDDRGRKLVLRLNYFRYPDSGGAFKVQISAPYVVVNKTGLPFFIRSIRTSRGSVQDAAGETRPDALALPTPYLLSHQADDGHDFSFRIGDSDWSHVLNVEAPTAESAVVIPSVKSKQDEVHIGVSWAEGLGKYKLSKVITLAPRFIIKNILGAPITFREHGVAPRDRSTINVGERCPLLALRSTQEKLLTIAYSGLNAHWSPPISIEDIGSVYFRLGSPGQDTVQLIRADVKIDGPTIFITFCVADEGYPFVIENGSDYSFTLAQRDTREEQANPTNKAAPTYTVKPHTSFPYAWDYPAAHGKKLVLGAGGTRRVIDIKEIGDLVPFKFYDGQRNCAVSLDVRADGHKQILSVTNYNPEYSLYRPKARSGSVPSVVRQDTVTSTEAFEAITEEDVPNFGFSVSFAGIGISLVNRKLVEVVYTSIKNFSFEYTSSSVAQTVNLALGHLQIDNQLHDAIFPVILQPSPIPQETGVAPLPTIQASVIWLNDDAHGVVFVKYCSVLLQALNVEADEDLLFAIYDLSQLQGVSWETNTEDVLIQYPGEIPEPQNTTGGADIYFEVLELQPIKLFLSFMRTESVSTEQRLNLQNPLAVVINAVTMAVGNVNDAPLELNSLAIKDMRLKVPELQSRIFYHYKQDVLRQLYRILGSADFIGNPVGLFTNVSSGVADIFYEPFNGVVMRGNQELGIGIAKGAASFVKKTVFGVSDSVTKFTSSVGKGLSAATFDSEYQAKRRLNQRRNKPRHAIYGVAAGGEALANSVASAMEGVVMKPIEGAESGGAFGFFKGVGKGMLGAVTKPVIGVFDLASNVSEGIRNTTTVFDRAERDRVRSPRLVPSDGVLVPYSTREAQGQYWMKDLNNGAYRKEKYVAHFNSPGSDNVALLTSSRVLSFWAKTLKLDWDLPFTEVQGVTVEDTGIRFAHKAGKAHDKFVFIPDKASQSWFFERVAVVVRTFNVKRRMDA
ncbi:vacuolar protein sorting-associated protein 13 [Cylindrobasidium torrendii FP15055 ss-10]|uniref:Vacuolar protein sorting-associated protein 13 n=1 Tax=Cylindrobasidium torrendii FP15055 ss-10 TaxID=1314674 RepID=A0A0D7BM22_9AGAR|nr:vacuolar protein sorting-associated protein 13 [Cylindrobasidium torrendii FP15055 ss-10]